VVKVAVLGHRGMLGSRLVSVLPARYHVVTFSHRWPGGLLDAIEAARPDWIINAISGTWEEWATLPGDLHARFPGRLIQPSTDAIGEDTDYARAKAVGEVGEAVIRCSIVDPAGGLLRQVYRSTTFHADTAPHWNGITALAWAGVADLVMSGQVSGLVIPGSPPTSIHTLATAAVRTFGWPTRVVPRETQGPDRVQVPTLEMPPIAHQLAEYG
jgi:hypothetical protein